MDWLPHIVVKAEDDASVKTATTALRTFDTGFPGHKATVHCIGARAHTVCKEWCSAGGHTLLEYQPSIRQSQLHYAIVKGSRLPVVLIRGTAVFYDDLSDYSTTKLFGAETFPKRYTQKGSDKLITLGGIEKTIVFVAQPMKLSAMVEEITKHYQRDVAKEAKGSKKWDCQAVIMDGKMYYQESGIFNLVYQWDKSLFTNLSKKTSSKFESVFGGNNYTEMVARLEEYGYDSEILLKYINAALNDDWKGIRGCRKAYLDMLKDVVVK